MSEDQTINKETDTGNKPAGVLDIFEPLNKEVPPSEDMEVVEIGYNLFLFFAIPPRFVDILSKVAMETSEENAATLGETATAQCPRCQVGAA